MTEIHNPNCDGAHCKSEWGVIRSLPTGGGGNALLCRHCFLHEIEYRRERNRELGEFAQFDLPSWDDVPLYPEDLFDAVQARGIQFDSHESDLYIPVTAETAELVKEYGRSAKAFTSQIDGKPWYDVPFAYLPWWQKRTADAN